MTNLKCIIRSKLNIICEGSLDKYLELCSMDFERGESHHILPSCLFKEFSDLKTNEFNKSILPLKEHILAHYYFSKATGLMWRCVWLMLKVNPRKSQLTLDEVIELTSLITVDKRLLVHSEKSKELMRVKRNEYYENVSPEVEAIRLSKLSEHMKNLDPKIRQSMTQGQKKTMRKSECWKFKRELYKLWIDNKLPKYKIFRKIATSNGYPDEFYGAVVKQFIADYTKEYNHPPILMDGRTRKL